MEVRVPFILIEDNNITMDSLKKVVERAVPSSPVYVFTDGLDGWEYIKKSSATNIIICNFYLPTLSGLKILKNIRSSDTLRKNYIIMITSDTEKEININAMHQGADDFLSVNFSVDELIGKLRSATRIVSLQIDVDEIQAQNEVLQNDLKNKTDELMGILYNIQEERVANFSESSVRIKEMTIWIAEEYGIKDYSVLSPLNDACNLCFTGKLFLPDTAINSSVTSSGLPKNEKMEKIPQFLKSLIGDIKGFEYIFNILYHIYENYDGSGIPEKRQSRQIPLGSRILRAVLDFEELYAQNKYEKNKIVELMSIESKRIYDPKIITLLDQYWAYKAYSGKIVLERPVHRRDLREGMVLSRQIVTESYMKLMSPGTYLTIEFIEKIQSITKNDPIIGKIYIRN